MTWGCVCVCVCVCVCDDFLVWIILDISISWIQSLGLYNGFCLHLYLTRYLMFYFILVFIACLMSLRMYTCLCSRYHFLCMFFDSYLSIHMYLLDFRSITDSLIFIYDTGHCMYLYAWITSLDHEHVWLPGTPTGFILRTRWVIFWQPWPSCPDPGAWTVVILL